MRNFILLLNVLSFTLANLSPNEYSTEFFYNFDESISKNEDETNLMKKDVKIDISDIRYYLYTRQNPYTPLEIINGDISVLNGSNFDPEKKILFVGHGWRGSKDKEEMVAIREAAIESYDLNVIIVDWSDPANNFYVIVQNLVEDVGELVGDFIYNLELAYNLNPSDIVLVGHSLGAHLMGVAASRIQEHNQTVEYIVGLDPAAPLYDLSSTGNRLDMTDANFVQVIHTSINILGIASPIGHSDYYPNGGSSQPGCILDITGFCAHVRAPLYYAESLKRGAVFLGKKCENYQTYNTGACDSNHQSPMGQFELDTTANGVYYLKTNANPPYGQE